MTDIVVRVAAKAVIANKKGQVLVLRESPKHVTNTRAGHYQLPGGRLEPGESFFDGLQREVKEETGLAVEINKPIMVGEWRPIIQGVPHQIVGIFMAAFTKQDKVIISDEHDDFVWIDPRKRSDYDIMSPDSEAIDQYTASL